VRKYLFIDQVTLVAYAVLYSIEQGEFKLTFECRFGLDSIITYSYHLFMPKTRNN
jgi:hypothetical protein